MTETSMLLFGRPVHFVGTVARPDGTSLLTYGSWDSLRSPITVTIVDVTLAAYLYGGGWHDDLREVHLSDAWERSRAWDAADECFVEDV